MLFILFVIVLFVASLWFFSRGSKSSSSAPRHSTTTPATTTKTKRKSIDTEQSLSDLQLVLLVDRSASMMSDDDDCSGGMTLHKPLNKVQWTRWDNVLITAQFLASEFFNLDSDGSIPIFFFESRVEEVTVRSVDDMERAFLARSPTGSTNLLGALEMAFSRHLNDSDKTIFVVFTDGEPNPGQVPRIKQLIEDKVVSSCRRYNNTGSDTIGNRVNILFIRHGDERSAIRFLQDLDDCQEIGDFVDTKSDNAVFKMGATLTILNAIHEHYDHHFQNM